MHIRKQIRKEQAAVRQAEHDKLSTGQKIAKAACRRGVSKREIAQLTKRLEAQ